FWFFRVEGREPLDTFEAALQGDPARFGSDTESRRICSYIDRSTYAPHVSRLFELFGHDSVHVVFLDEFRADPTHALAPVLGAPGLDPALRPDAIDAKNTAREVRSSSLARMTRPRGPLARALRPLLPQSVRDRMRHQVRNLNEVAAEPPTIDPATETEL